MGIIGDTLRKAREDKGLTLQQVEEQTNMRWKYLEALEKESFDTIPGQTYVKGFLRNYANFLGVDGQLLLDVYREHLQELENAQALEDRIAERKAKKQEKKMQSTDRTGLWLAALITVVLLGGVAYGWSIMAKPAVVNNPKPPVKQGDNSKPKPQAPANGQGQGEPTNGTGNGANPNEAANGQQQGSVGGAVYQGNGENQAGVKVALTITEQTSWLRVLADGKNIFEGDAKPGEVKTFQATSKITVKAGNAGAVSVMVNNQDKGKMGAFGKVVTLDYP